MSRLVLGIDIRPDAVSAVQVRSSIKGNRIEAHLHVPIPDQERVESGIGGALETIAAKMDIAGSACVVSLPADEISYRNIKVPFKEPRKIRQMLPFELEPALPLPIEDVIIDFRAVRVSQQTDIIAAVVEKSRMKSYLETLAFYKIEPRIVTIGGYPTTLCLSEWVDVPENWLLVDIGRHRSTVFAILSGQLHLVRSFPISSSAATATESLCKNIEQTIVAFQDIFSFEFLLNSLFITGYGLNDHDDTEQHMARILGLPVERINLGQQTELTRTVPPLAGWDPSRLDNALALALAGIEGINGLNFRRGPFAPKKNWEAYKKSLIKSGILAGTVLILASLNLALDSYTMRKQIERLNRQINGIFTTTFPDVKRIVDPLQQMRVKIDELRQKTLFPGERQKQILTIDILYALSKSIPKDMDVEFKRLVMGADNLQISGETDTFNSVDAIKSRLEGEESLKKVTISSATMSKSGNRVSFKMRVEL